MTDTGTEIRDAPRLRALWTGLLLAPAAWLTSLEVGYVLVRPDCIAGTLLRQHRQRGDDRFKLKWRDADF